MIMAILVLVIAGIVVTVALGATQNVTREVNEQGRRGSSQLVAEGAVNAIAGALQSRGDVLGDSLAITPAVVRAAATQAGGTVTDAAVDFAFPSGIADELRFTVRNQPGTNDVSAWQVLGIVQPDIAATPPRNFVTVYIRGWTGSGNRTTKPVTLKARLRPGTFFDYQVISDVSIAFEPGTVITGDVHTNGFIDDVLLPGGLTTDRIWSTSPVSCTTPAGGKQPVVSTARGTIRNVSPTSCQLRPNSDESISLARAATSFRAMQANNGVGGTRVFEANAGAPANGTWSVNLASGFVTSSWGQSGVLAAAGPAGGRAALFDRDVIVSGNVTGRLTIATRANDAGVGATSVRINGNVTVSPQSATAKNAVALIAENDVVVGCSTHRVHAALVAMSGAVTIPREHRQSVVVGTTPPACGNIAFIGSIASHGSIVMQWRVGGINVGFSQRTYTWDPWFAYYPPPYIPLAQPWEVSGLEVADGNCFVTSSPTAVGGCS